MSNTMNTTLPELLVPAGNREKLETAILYGADAVYLAGPGLHLRAGEAGFQWEDLGPAIAYAHARGVKVYFCFNAFPTQPDMPLVHDFVARLAGLDVDGLIIADPGVASLCKRRLPHLEIHVSTQANTANSESALFWKDFGATRVNLARELSKEAIAEIVAAVPDMETEVFVHGALCLSISGRCLLSDWVNDRAANKGQCTQPCRFRYKPVEAVPRAVLIDEQLRSGEPLWEVVEEDTYSAMFAPHDICLLPHLPWFASSGVSSLKIEGRMKSAIYLARATDAYRTALNAARSDAFNASRYMPEVHAAATRPLSSGFFLGSHREVIEQEQNIVEKGPVAARILRNDGQDRFRISVRSTWKADTDTELLLPGLVRVGLAAGSYAFENHKGEKTDVLHPGTEAVLRAELDQVPEGIFIGTLK